MDFSTEYLGLRLANPLLPGSSPVTGALDFAKRLEDAGAAAIVMPSLFEEEIIAGELHTRQSIDGPSESFAEAISYFPETPNLRVGPDEYLANIRKLKTALAIPVIASLNGYTPGGWLRLARDIQSAGADALELNVYFLATDPAVSGDAIERRTLDLLTEIRGITTLPLAVKLSPFYTSLPHFAARLAECGANGIVVLNRFMQPDLDIEALDVTRVHHLSTPADLLLRLRWLAILSNRVRLSLAVTGGVHSAEGALKAVMAGAHAVQMVSTLLMHGPEQLRRIHSEMIEWLERHEYESLRQACGSLSLQRSPDPAAFERANYVQILQTWQARDGFGKDWFHAAGEQR